MPDSDSCAKIPVAIAGGGGLVGQQFKKMLAGHPLFRLVAEVGAVDRGYDGFDQTLGAKIIFSALPPMVAAVWEPRWLEQGLWVFSNSGADRLADLRHSVPMVPEVNPELHAELFVSAEPSSPRRILSPNCTAHGLVIALAPLRAFGLSKVMVQTMQALSGAGRGGVPQLEGGDNLLPFIAQEEERLEAETALMLGGSLQISAQCNRVAISHGHTLSVSVKLGPGVQQNDLLEAWRKMPDTDLPSCQASPVQLMAESDRPQPKLDRDAGQGMLVSIGRLRPCPVLDFKFTVLVHNLIRGAAGAALLNAEFMFARGCFEGN